MKSSSVYCLDRLGIPHAGSAPRGTTAGLEKDLGDIKNLYILPIFALQTVLEHRHAERACRKDMINFEFQGLGDTIFVDPSPEILLHPHPATAGTTAETSPPPPLKFH